MRVILPYFDCFAFCESLLNDNAINLTVRHRGMELTLSETVPYFKKDCISLGSSRIVRSYFCGVYLR